MAHKAIREYDGKMMIARQLQNYGSAKVNLKAAKASAENIDALAKSSPWLLNEKLVVKPDVLLKRRGKNGLVLLGASFDDAKEWIKKMSGKETVVGDVSGVIDTFIIEPFIEHEENEEMYLCIRSVFGGDEILFSKRGGINVGDVDSNAKRARIEIGEDAKKEDILSLFEGMEDAKKKTLAEFAMALFSFYQDLNYVYLEINPLVIKGDEIYLLDLAAKLDDTAEFECAEKWGNIEFPPPFGRKLLEEEKYIKELDMRTGASLKLTVLNPEGRIWTMVAGGGASVIYADTIADLGCGSELANYGEYSGNPNEEFTYLYAKTIIDLMTRKPHPKGKVLIIGGGIANFTDVAQTFKGIIRAIREYAPKLREQKVRIYVRRGGPNYKEGLELMRSVGKETGVPISVYGPETHMTAIVSKALSEEGLLCEKKIMTSSPRKQKR